MTSENRRYYLLGIIPILVASILWAFTFFLRKTVLNDVSPFFMTFASSFLVTVVMPICYKVNIFEAWRTFRQHIALYILLSLTGVVVGTTLMYMSLKRIDLGVCTLVEKTQPIFILVFAAVILKESVTLRQSAYAA